MFTSKRNSELGTYSELGIKTELTAEFRALGRILGTDFALIQFRAKFKAVRSDQRTQTLKSELNSKLDLIQSS